MAKTANDYSAYIARSVKEFLDYLLPSADHWRSAKRGDLAYRGQSSSIWQLVPRAFRRRELARHGHDASDSELRRVVAQARAEFHAVHEFVKAADAAGLRITEAGGRLLEEEPSHVFGGSDWEYSWPQEELLEIIALAQHYGVPTRLLDFTEDPLVAAYFAASSAWDEQRQGLVEGHANYLAVWVIDLRFVRAINRIVHRYPERIAEVRVPRFNNPYLRAQFGFFLIDRGANDVMTTAEPPSIDRATADRARFWHNGKRLSAKGIMQTWFDELPVRQVRLNAKLTVELLKELGDRGVTKGNLTPSLDRVVEALEFERSIP